MDERCRLEEERLREDAQSKQIGLRTALFSATYIGIGAKEAAITKIFSDLSSGMATFNRPRVVTFEMVQPLVKKGLLGYGELYLLILLLRWRDDLQNLHSFILSSLQKWRNLPYHLTLEILQQAPYAYKTEDQRQAIIAALTEMHNQTQNLWLSTSIFEALGGLGALTGDAEAHVETVENDIFGYLAISEQQAAWDGLAGIYYAQFDHPYDTAYQQAIQHLREPDKKQFFMMALQGFHSSIFTISLVTQAWKLYGVEIAPLIVRWTETPFITPHFPQDSIAIFFIAHLLLAKSQHPLISRFTGAGQPNAKSLFAAAELVYWVNREDIDSVQSLTLVEAAQEALFSPDNRYVIETIWQARHSLHQCGIFTYFDASAITKIVEMYKAEVVSACRRAISAPGVQCDIMNFPHNKEVEIHAIELLAETGSLVDLDILRPLADHVEYGLHAVRAIKLLSEQYI
jgi:hypothetical protein